MHQLQACLLIPGTVVKEIRMIRLTDAAQGNVTQQAKEQRDEMPREEASMEHNNAVALETDEKEGMSEGNQSPAHTDPSTTTGEHKPQESHNATQVEGESKLLPTQQEGNEGYSHNGGADEKPRAQMIILQWRWPWQQALRGE